MTGRRVHERFDCDLVVTVLHGEGHQEELGTQAANVSLGGLYLLTDQQLEYGSEVKLRFQLPALKEQTECAATVRWNKPDGFGVQFGSLRAIEVWALHQYFKQLTPSPPAG